MLAYRHEIWWREAWVGSGRALSLRPMYEQRDDHATGLIRLLAIALRVLTLLEFVVRRQLAASGATLSGLYAGNAKRETARPTAERLLGAFQEVTLTVVKRGPQVYRQVTALSPLQERILDLLGFSSRCMDGFAPFLTNRSKNGRTVRSLYIFAKRRHQWSAVQGLW